MLKRLNYIVSCCGLFAVTCANLHVAAQDVAELVDHRYADNEGVEIHYAVMGDGPLLVMLHGFPDYWYT